MIQSAAPQEFLTWVDANASKFIERLGDAVAIPSVSNDSQLRPKVIAMADFLERKLKDYGVTIRRAELGKQKLEDGTMIDYPPVILGKMDNKKPRTILIYGHYDVQPASKKDGWTTEDPFKLHIDTSTNRLIGRGSSDDKGPVTGWINVLQWHHEKGQQLPVNLRFCFEGMEESDDGGGLVKVIEEESKPGKWFDGVNAVCITDNYWLTTKKPTLTYGVRGVVDFGITISGPMQDLHSGLFGGMVYEPMTDLITIMSKLVDNRGHILITGVDDQVASVTPAEKQDYEKTTFSAEDLKEAVGGIDIAITSDKVELLERRMQRPSLSLIGIEGAYSGEGVKTVIPAKVTGKFSIRLVPNQTPEEVVKLVKTYTQAQFQALNSKNNLESVKPFTVAEPWVTKDVHNDWSYQAAERATKSIYGQDPDYTRDGGSIPMTLTLQENLKVSVLLLPMGRSDDGAHSINEKIDRENYVNGTKLFGSYLYEVAK